MFRTGTLMSRKFRPLFLLLLILLLVYPARPPAKPAPDLGVEAAVATAFVLAGNMGGVRVSLI